MMRPIVVAIAVAVSLAGPVTAQRSRAVLEADVTEATVGDRITATIMIEHAADQSVRWSDSVSLAPFEILGFAPGAPRVDGDRAVSEATLTLAVFELGEVAIPSLSLALVDPSGGEEVVTTDPFVIGVQSVGLDETGDIRDVKGPRDIAFAWLSAWPLLLALLLGILLAVRALRRRGDRAPGARPAAPPRPAHEIAYDALDRLEGSTMLERGQVKDFHIAVSQVLRTYIEDRFGIDALEMTTGELIAALRNGGFGGTLIDETRRFLDACDLVKFAKRRPDASESLALIPIARQFVDETRPAEPERMEPEPAESEAA